MGDVDVDVDVMYFSRLGVSWKGEGEPTQSGPTQSSWPCSASARGRQECGGTFAPFAPSLLCWTRHFFFSHLTSSYTLISSFLFPFTLPLPLQFHPHGKCLVDFIPLDSRPSAPQLNALPDRIRPLHPPPLKQEAGGRRLASFQTSG